MRFTNLLLRSYIRTLAISIRGGITGGALLILGCAAIVCPCLFRLHLKTRLVISAIAFMNNWLLESRGGVKSEFLICLTIIILILVLFFYCLLVILLFFFIIRDIIDTELLTRFVFIPVVIIIVNNGDIHLISMFSRILSLCFPLLDLAVMEFNSANKVGNGPFLLFAVLVCKRATLVIGFIHGGECL